MKGREEGPSGSGGGGNDEPGEARRDTGWEHKILRVHALDWVDINIRDDGRFLCELKKPVAALQPAQARKLLVRLEPVLEQLRAKAGRA